MLLGANGAVRSYSTWGRYIGGVWHSNHRINDLILSDQVDRFQGVGHSVAWQECYVDPLLQNESERGELSFQHRTFISRKMRGLTELPGCGCGGLQESIPDRECRGKVSSALHVVAVVMFGCTVVGNQVT